MKMVEEDAVIVGAGVAGLATAVALKKVGIRALVLEKSDGLRATGSALTLSLNGLLALDALGVCLKLTSLYAPSKRFLVTDIGTGEKQELPFTATNRIEDAPRTMHRKTLLQALADELPVDSIHFSSKISSIETQTQQGFSIAVLHLDDGTTIKAKILIGCDGVNSMVARWLGLSGAVTSGRSAVRGLAVFPQGHGLSKNIQQLVDVGLRAGFIPLNDKEVYWFITCQSPPKGEKYEENPEKIQEQIIDNYAKNFPPVYLNIVRHSDLSTLLWAPLMLRYPWDIMFGNLNKGNITVAGDAMHPMTPDLGQGGCTALEDAVALGRHIGNSMIKNGKLVPGEIAGAIDGYVKERRWRATWLVAGSFMAGWVQQAGSSWWMKYFRDGVFYKYFFGKIVGAIQCDCGKLPDVSLSGELGKGKKME